MIEHDYGCFRCGVINGEIDYVEDINHHVCGECGEAAIVTFQQSLDMLNAHYIEKKYEKEQLELYGEFDEEGEYTYMDR